MKRYTYLLYSLSLIAITLNPAYAQTTKNTVSVAGYSSPTGFFDDIEIDDTLVIKDDGKSSQDEDDCEFLIKANSADDDLILVNSGGELKTCTKRTKRFAPSNPWLQEFSGGAYKIYPRKQKLFSGTKFYLGIDKDPQYPLDLGTGQGSPTGKKVAILSTPILFLGLGNTDVNSLSLYAGATADSSLVDLSQGNGMLVKSALTVQGATTVAALTASGVTTFNGATTLRGNTLVNGDVSISGNVAILGGLVATIKSSAFLSTSIKDTLTSTGQTYLGQTLIQPNADINPALMIVTREAIPLNITTSNATNAININGKDLIALETTGTMGKVYTYAVYAP